VAAWPYGGVPRDLVLALKFRRRLDAADPLADALAAALVGWGVPGDLLVPVALSARRRRRRGHDQAAVLARAVGRRLGVEVSCRALVRRRDTPPQVGRSRAQRRRGPRGAFRARRRLVLGRSVLLVDDVLTTGATATAAAIALRRAGARSIVAATACRTESPRPVPASAPPPSHAASRRVPSQAHGWAYPSSRYRRVRWTNAPRSSRSAAASPTRSSRARPPTR
jgi:ComF family protein